MLGGADPRCCTTVTPTTGPTPWLCSFSFSPRRCIEDIEGEVSTFLRSNNTLPNNWVLVDGLHAAHWLRHRPREVRAALSDLAEV